ncbi:hypothetical protein TRVL_08540 [Trypanosoma vivax]|nr:hypothetical protein TRVL_08540 [Trypanosoma vivax]
MKCDGAERGVVPPLRCNIPAAARGSAVRSYRPLPNLQLDHKRPHRHVSSSTPRKALEKLSPSSWRGFRPAGHCARNPALATVLSHGSCPRYNSWRINTEHMSIENKRGTTPLFLTDHSHTHAPEQLCNGINHSPRQELRLL